MTGHNECMAAAYRVVQLAAWKITVWSSYQKLVALGCLPVLVTTGAGWRWSGWLSHWWYFLSSLVWAWAEGAAPRGCGTQGLRAPSLAQLIPTHWGRTTVFTPLFLGGLMVLGRLSGNGKKVLHVVFRILDKNSQQAFPLLWSVSRGREKEKTLIKESSL